MIRIAICDDENVMRGKTRQWLDTYSVQRNIDIDCHEFSTGIDFLKDESRYNMIILDYQISENVNGISIAKKLRTYDKDIHIIFLTSHPKVVFSSFEVNTFRFLIKPLNPDKLFKALDDYVKSTEEDDTVLNIKLSGVTNGAIKMKNIMYLEGMGKYAMIHTDTEKIECRETLADVEKRLLPELFVRCHRSFIVNMRYITAYDYAQALLTDNREVPISKKKYDEFKSAFISYTKNSS